MTAPVPRRKRRAPRTPISRGFKLPADISVRTIKRCGSRDIEVDISADRLARLARAGRVPDQALDELRDRLESLIVNLVESGDDMRAQRHAGSCDTISLSCCAR